MWNMKSTLLFVASLVAVILISMNMASADDKVKTITPQEFATNVAEVPGKLVNFIGSEVEKTKAYQTKVWSETMKTWPWNKIFKKDKE